jgi:hypothetical protein
VSDSQLTPAQIADKISELVIQLNSATYQPGPGWDSLQDVDALLKGLQALHSFHGTIISNINGQIIRGITDGRAPNDPSGQLTEMLYSYGTETRAAADTAGRLFRRLSKTLGQVTGTRQQPPAKP